MALKNVIFDIGNVLVEFRPEDYMRDLGFSEEAIGKISELIILGGIWDQLDLGIKNPEDIYNEMKAVVPEYQELIDVFIDEDKVKELVRPYDYAEEWVKSVKEKGYNVYLLTNYPERMFDIHEKAGRFPFIPYIDGKVVSAKVKMAKPDSSIYELLLEKYNLDPKECMFFDDRPVNVEAAKKLGIDARLFENYEKAKEMIPQ